MTTLRRHKRDFTIIGNDCFRDKRLKAEALGVICYLRSKPHDWTVRISELGDRFDCGRDRIQRILKELITAGYIRKVRQRDPVSKSWKAVEFLIQDIVDEPLPENTVVASETSENLPMGEPPLENPAMGFTSLLNTESTKNGIIQSTETDSPSLPLGDAIEGELLTPRQEAELFFDKQFWPAYPKRFGSNPKEPARKKLVAAILRGEKPQEILVGVKRLFSAMQRSGKIGTEYVPMALTWINRRQWKDDPQPPKQPERPKSFVEAALNFEAELYGNQVDDAGTHHDDERWRG